jgi:hypothetical protein
MSVEAVHTRYGRGLSAVGMGPHAGAASWAVDVVVEGGPRPVHGLRRMAVLATLALHCGEVVGTGRLIDVVSGPAGGM